MKSIPILIYLLIWSLIVNAQNEPRSIRIAELDSLTVIEAVEKTIFLPITYQKPGTEFKKVFKVSGVIEEQSSAGFLCGFICHSGTIKIETVEPQSGIDASRVVYILIPCFVHDEKDIGKVIDVTLTNLPEDRDIGCFRNVWNTIESNGEAFYYCENWEIK